MVNQRFHIIFLTGCCGNPKPLSHITDESRCLPGSFSSVFVSSAFLFESPVELPSTSALCCLKQRYSHTREPETDPNALNFWMGRAEGTLTCLWGCELGRYMILCLCLFADFDSRSLTRALSLSPSLSLAVACSLSLSSSSTGLSSSCRWSWLSWNCRATFPVVLATSCSITCLMTALLQDLWGSENLCHLDAYLYKHAGVNDWCILWYKHIFMIRVRSSPSAKMSRQYKVGRNPSVGKVNCVWMGALSGVRNVLGAVTHFARALCHSVVLQAFYNVWIFYTISDDIRG